MADLFISYNRGDREIVERLAERFGRYGVEIWFDARLEQGDPFESRFKPSCAKPRPCW